MKRLIAKNENLIMKIVTIHQPEHLKIGDNVIFKNNPTDGLAYTIIDILYNGTLLLSNDTGMYSGVLPSTVEKIDFSEI